VRQRLARGLRSPAARAVVAAAVVVSVTVTALWWSTNQPRPPSQSTDAVRVGVAPGGSIPEYIESARHELFRYTGGTTYALVTFDAYRNPMDLAGVLAGLDVAEVIVRVPLPGEQTEITRLGAQRLPDDVLAGLDRLAARKEAEAIEYRRLATQGDLILRDSYADGARIAAAEADAMRQRNACVYAVVVRGPAAALSAAAGRAGVRVVDPAPEVTELTRAVFRPPLPEQSDIARPPIGR
jgi:hypothetical protein